MLKLQEIPEQAAPTGPHNRYLEGWMNRIIVVQVVNMPTEYSYPTYVGTLAGVDRDANGSIQSILLSGCSAGSTQRTFHADNVLVWSSVLRISLPTEGLLKAHQELIEKVQAGLYIFR